MPPIFTRGSRSVKVRRVQERFDAMNELEEDLRRWMSGRRPLWGLDFDGTLVDLQPDPEGVLLGERGVAVVTRLAELRPCVLISGRALGDLMRHAPIRGAGFIGNHGCQVLQPGRLLWEWRSAEWERWRSTCLAGLRAWVESRSAWLEDKEFSLTVHFKGEAQSREWWSAQGGAELRRRIGQGACLLAGHLAWNITAPGAPDKGRAALSYCRDLGLDSVVYFGDEPTDESVFSLTEVPIFGIKVRPGETCAQYRIDRPSQVLDFIERFV